jgi:hypothetical protein
MMVKVNKREHLLKTVCRNIINNPRRVDADAVAAFRKAVLQYVDVQNIDRGQALKIYDSEGEVGVMVREAFDVLDASNVLKGLDDREYSPSTGAAYPRNRWYLDLLRDPDDIDEEADRDEDDEDEDDEEIEKVKHHASTVADLLVESGRFPDRPAALHHLLHKPGGRALLASLHKAIKQTKKESTMTRTEALRDIAKGSIIAVAKAMTDENRSFGITEHEFTELATEHAERLFPDKTREGAFAKLFCDNGADSVVLRKAYSLVKALTPTMVGGPDQMHEAVDNTESSEAYRQLEAMAAKMRSASPELSAAQAFERVFTDKRNAGLAAKAHVRPSATTSYPFPR